MIVTYKEAGWEVITQRSHGIVAAQIAMQWKKKERPDRWTETVLAIAEHDDAETELDGENLLTEGGGPLNFDMKKFELGHCQKLAMLTITKSRYIALITSLHMDFLYRKDEKEDKEAHQFLQEQRRLQTLWRKELGIKEEEVKRLYSLLEWCDALSLLLCQNQIQPEKRAIEVSTGPDNVQYSLFQISDKALTIDPWPFERTAFTVYFESRTISQLQFRSSAEFREAFVSAPVKETVWDVRKKPAKHREPSKIK